MPMNIPGIPYVGSFTWSSRPTSAQSGAIARITDIGPASGTYVSWDGTYWRVIAPTDIVFDLSSQDAASLSTAEQIIKQANIPAGLLRVGRSFNVRWLIGKSGTVDAATATRLRLGLNGTTADAQIVSFALPASGNRSASTEFVFAITSATQLRILSHQNGNGAWVAGGSGAAYPTNVSISDVDANAIKISCSMQMAGTTDTGQIHHLIISANP